MKINIALASAKLKAALLRLAGKITAGSAEAIADITNIVSTVQKIASTVQGDIPLLTAALDGPIGTAIASYLPSGEADRAAIIAVINKFLPFIQKAADPTVMTALTKSLTAEILLIQNKLISDIDVAMRDVTYLSTEIEDLEAAA